MLTTELITVLNSFLNITAFHDYAPQGLQVEGKVNTRKIVTAVTASLQAIKFAARAKADMLLVHHGLFWRNEPLIVSGWKRARLKELLVNELNLAAYHLPLDAHPEVGNNIQLARQLNWDFERASGPHNLLFQGRLKTPAPLAQLCADLSRSLGRAPLAVGNPAQKISRIAWCSGGGQNFFLDAVALGVDAFITGEASEAQYHYANESGVAFIAAGHFATERAGIMALGQWLQTEYALETVFFDENNPI